MNFTTITNTNIEVIDFYTPTLVSVNPNKLYVFGDNTRRIGRGGQAIIRHCINSFGITTKINPDMRSNSFFNDRQEEFTYVLQGLSALTAIYLYNVYDAIVFPSSGIGTGLSRLPECSPLILNMIDTYFELFFNIKKNDKTKKYELIA